MAERTQFFLSKTLFLIALLGGTCMMIGAAIAGIVLFLGAKSIASGLFFVLGLAWLIILFSTFFLWKKLVFYFEKTKIPMISFEDGAVRYCTMNDEFKTTKIKDISGIEINAMSPRFGGGYLSLHKINAEKDKIFIYSLDASPDEILAAFKTNLPHLIQANRYHRGLV